MAKKQTEVVEGTEALEALASAPAKRVTLASIDRTEQDTLNVAFSDGETLLVDPSEFSEEIKNELMFLGLGNKLRDSWASAKGDLAFAKGAANKTLDNLKNGLFTASRASGSGVQKVGELIQAIANIKGKDVPAEEFPAFLAKVKETVDAASPETVATWRKNAQVKVEIQRLRLEAARARLEKASAETSGELVL